MGSTPLGCCIGLFFKNFFSNFRSYIKDSKWGRKCIFINCTSCNGSPQQIPFQFANGKLPHSHCRAFWAIFRFESLFFSQIWEIFKNVQNWTKKNRKTPFFGGFSKFIQIQLKNSDSNLKIYVSWGFSLLLAPSLTLGDGSARLVEISKLLYFFYKFDNSGALYNFFSLFQNNA